MLQIGRLKIDSQVLLAPIAGYTDLAFRLAVRAAGHTGLTYTELLNPRGLLSQSPSTLDIARVANADEPFGVQLYGNDADWFCAAARWAEEQGAAVVDVNMGCPVDKVTKTNGGSMLLCDPARTTRMVERIVDAVAIPVTAKLRLGWDRDQLTAPALARALEEIGVQLITIHGRTTADRFKGSVDLDGIASVVAAVRSIPVIGNGDIQSPDDALRMRRHTGCAGVMVARAAIKRPWILRQIDALLKTGRRLPEPTVREKLGVIREHFEQLIEQRGERHAVTVMRQRIGNYGVSLGHVKWFKERIRLMDQPATFFAAVEELATFVDPGWTSVPHHVRDGASAAPAA